MHLISFDSVTVDLDHTETCCNRRSSLKNSLVRNQMLLMKNEDQVFAFCWKVENIQLPPTFPSVIGRLLNSSRQPSKKPKYSNLASQKNLKL